MEPIELLRKQVEIIGSDVIKINKAASDEFTKIAKAFGQMGNLVDLLYLEMSVMIEILTKAGILKEQEFEEALKAAALKVEQSIKEEQERIAKESQEVKPEVPEEKK